MQSDEVAVVFPLVTCSGYFGDLQRLLSKLGFRLDRVTGSHHIYVREGVTRPINIQPVGKDAKSYQVRQLRDIIEEFGLKLED